MKYLIYVAGTIGITYAWLLSKKHDVDLFVRSKRLEQISRGLDLHIKDLRQGAVEYEKFVFNPRCVTEFAAQYDGVLVCVNRYELKGALPFLAEHQHLTTYFAFLQNNWNLKEELEAALPVEKTVIAFPSSVGGGRSSNRVDAIVFDEATRLGGECQIGISNL